MKREKIFENNIKKALESIDSNTAKRLVQNGHGTFCSSHEVLGVIAEEYDELKDAIRENDLDKVKKELLDIATACHFSLACLEQKTLDW